jgi:hypothetical protein
MNSLYVSSLKGALNRYPKIPFTNPFEIRIFVSVKYDEIDVGEQFSNAATLLTYQSNEKKNFKINVNCDSFQIVFKMSFTADEYCNM